MAGAAAAESVPANHTLKTAALRRPDHVEIFVGLEDIGFQFRTRSRNLFRRADTHFPQHRRKPVAGDSRFREMPGAGLGHILRLALTETQLNRRVAVALHGLDIGHHARTGLNHRHRDQYAVLVVDLSHADLFTD
ncbi:hypothetical protein SDC9_108176 [bioreactor metagenome]|uniref:Uncharacterized protein n=1 Tax=bioreactor metagenome TaxID=1076179 RepID=A0A645B8D6_9ZZZZ